MHAEEYESGFDDPSTESRLRFRSSGDRTCPDCNAVALAFDVEAGRSRCRSCGALE